MVSLSEAAEASSSMAPLHRVHISEGGHCDNIRDPSLMQRNEGVVAHGMASGRGILYPALGDHCSSWGGDLCHLPASCGRCGLRLACEARWASGRDRRDRLWRRAYGDLAAVCVPTGLAAREHE